LCSSNSYSFDSLISLQDCATSCWTPRTALSTRDSSSARCATRASTAPRATASAVALAASAWTPVTTLPRRRRQRECPLPFPLFSHLSNTHSYTHLKKTVASFCQLTERKKDDFVFPFRKSVVSSPDFYQIAISLEGLSFKVKIHPLS
jgi:hypothetical protein